MHPIDNLSDRANIPSSVRRGDSDDDLELAYQLQHGRPGDVHIQFQLVERFAAELLRMVAGWIALVRGHPASSDEIRLLTVETLATVWSQIEQFRGEESIRNWIYRLAVRRLQKYQWWRLVARKGSLGQYEGALEKLSQLTRRERSIIWLRYGMGLCLADCAKVLFQPVQKARKALNAGRLKLLPQELLGDGDEAYQESLQILWDHSDGLIDERQEAMTSLELHLGDQQLCQRIVEIHSVFEQTVAGEMVARWSLPILDTEENQELNTSIAEHKKIIPFPGIPPQWIKAGWTGLLILAFMAAGYFWMNGAGNDQGQAVAPTPSVSRLPDLIQGGLAPNVNFTDSGNEQQIQLVAQDQSEDGRWIVYKVTEIQVNNVDYINRTQVYLYDANAKTTQSIFDNPHALMSNQSAWFNPPVISADGARITFNAPGNLLNGEPLGCLTEAGGSCMDIYVYERNTGVITTLTQGWNGAPSDGDSYAPAISADGRVITFWSTASNLIEGQTLQCEAVDQPEPCILGYIYTFDTGELSQLPVPSLPGALGLEHMSLSADGRFVLFTPLTLGSTGVPMGYQSYLYDRMNGTLEDINQASDGTPGNGHVYGAVNDASGRYVAFVSSSANLVPGDSNGFVDVFWKDRQTSRLVRVSVGMDGQEANGHSGILAPGAGFTTLDLSPDGQLVVYKSFADNLVAEPGSCADQTQEICNGLFVYNFHTGNTELVAPRRSNGSNYFPAVTGDGRWITYADLRYDCQSPKYCSDILRYDRQRGWTYNLTGNNWAFPGYSWLWMGSMSLPGVETYAMAYAQDGAFLATANSDARVRVFQVADQSEYGTFEVKGSSSVISLDISPDNALLAGGTASGGVYVWNLFKKLLDYSLEESTGRVIDVFFSDDSSLLYAVTAEQVSVWRFGEQVISRINKIPLEGPRVLDTDLSPAGNLLASARQDGTVWLQNLSNELVMARLSGGAVAISEVVFSPDGSHLASRSVDGTVNIWEVSWQGFGALDVRTISSFSSPNWIGDLAILSDGSTLATVMSDGGVGIWDVEGGRSYRIIGPRFDDLIFAPHGDTLATAAYGSVDLWDGPGLTTGSYFTHTEADIFSASDSTSASSAIDLSFPQWWTAENCDMDLYEADETWQFDLIAPAHLPEGIVFQGANLIDTEGVLLYYKVESDVGSPGDLFILEQPVTDILPTMWVGESAEAREHSIGGVRLEFVGGDWLPKASPGADALDTTWIWDGNSGSSRLRWQEDDLLITMYYQAADDNPTSISREDMFQIASGFQLVSQSPREEITMLEYSVQLGDTCTWIADRFGVPIEAIVRANNLGGSCDFIFAGQGLMIPITHISYTQDEADLNCDGTKERVEVFKDADIWSGVRVLVQNDTGFFVPAWEWILEDPTVERFEWIRVLETADCISLLALNVMSDLQSSWSVFSWDGVTMQPLEIDPLDLERLLRP